MILIRARHIDSLFRRIDPRVRLLWMLVISILAMVSSRPESLVLLILTLIPVWILAKSVKLMVYLSVRLMPFLLFLLMLQLIPRFIFGGISEDYLFRIWQMDLSDEEIRKGIVETLRFFAMLQSAQVLLATMDFGELTSAIRQVAPRIGVVDRFLGVFAFILGIAFQSLPLLSGELETIVEVQRSRGVDVTKGGRLQQVKKLVRMGVPLFVRSLELAKGTGLALLNYAFHPTKPRSIYHRLRMEKTDWLFAILIIVTTLLVVVARLNRISL